MSGQKTMATSGSHNKRKSSDEMATDISLSIRAQDGVQLFFRVSRDLELIKVFREFCKRRNMEFETMQFLYEGSYLNGRQTPKMLNMENDAEILAARHQTGGGGAALSF